MTVRFKGLGFNVKKAMVILPLFALVVLSASYAEAAGFGFSSGPSGWGISVSIGGWTFSYGVSTGFTFGSSGLCGQAVSGAALPGGGGIGQVLCNITTSTELLPGLISGIAYMAGLILTVVAILKLKDHVLNPDRTPLSESMKRFVAGGAFFALPAVTNAVQTLLIGDNAIGSYDQTGFGGSVSASGGLDAMVVLLVQDIWQPLQILLASFSYLAGLVFVVIGIGRLIKTSQEGPRGPSGIGTIMTFVTAGVLFSLDNIMGAFSTSMFDDSLVSTYAVLSSSASTGDMLVDDHIVAVISAVIGFMALVGWISFIRGFFILRDVAEGNGQASLMAAVTHMFGGALAVNLGPLMNVVQSTFGLTPFGVEFT